MTNQSTYVCWPLFQQSMSSRCINFCPYPEGHLVRCYIGNNLKKIKKYQKLFQDLYISKPKINRLRQWNWLKSYNENKLANKIKIGILFPKRSKNLYLVKILLGKKKSIFSKVENSCNQCSISSLLLCNSSCKKFVKLKSYFLHTSQIHFAF